MGLEMGSIMTILKQVLLASALAPAMIASILGIQATAQPVPNSSLPPGARAEAQAQANRFDKAFRSGGMSGVSVDIDDCYNNAMQSGERLFLRECLVYDSFADRFAGMVHRQNANMPIPPYFLPATAYQRLARYSGPAGFNDAQIMLGYLRQGVNSIFAALSEINHRRR